MTRQQFHTKVYLYLSCLIAFFLPVYINIAPFLIGLLSLNWMMEGKFKEKIFMIKENKMSWLFIGFYFLFILGMLWTDNQPEGWFDLQVKFSFFLFPLIFSSINFYSSGNLKKILLSFVLGCMAGTLYCFLNALFMWYYSGENYFFYMKLSPVLHPSYLSMYITFSLATMGYHMIKKETMFGNILIDLLLSVWFWFCIQMLQSKAGILIGSSTLFLLLCTYSFRSKKILLCAGLAILYGGIFWGVSKFVITTSNSRILNAENNIISEQKIDKHSSESSQVRILIWQASYEVIKQNLLLGVGTGDVKDDLMKEYQKEKMNGAYVHRLNAHNQYIQTTVALGLIGFVAIILNFIIPFINSIRKNKFLLTLFLIIVGLNLLVESMFEVESGVMFYAFFNSLLLFSDTVPSKMSKEKKYDPLLPSQDHR